MYFFWGSNLFRVYNQKSRTPSDGTCFGEPPGGFCDVSCHFIFISSFCCCSSFVNVLHSHFLFDIIPYRSVDYRQVFTLILYFQSSPSQSDSWHFHFQPFRHFLTASATVLSGHFLPTGVFYPTLLLDIFGTTCFYKDFPGSWKLFLEICRVSHWSSKNRPGPSVCLIDSNPQYSMHLKFVFIHVNIAKFLLVVKTSIKYIDQQPNYSAAMKIHENIKQQPQ